MFPFNKTQRLLTKKDYDFVFQRARKIVTGEFIVLYRANNLSHARLGLAISKKMVAKAHDRNRIKRLLRESFRKKALPAVDIIFLARTGLVKKDNTEIHSKLSTLWVQLTSYHEK